MEIGCLPFNKTGYFSKLIEDYVSGNSELTPFYGQKPDLNGLNIQRKLKTEKFSLAQRKILQQVLTEQYKGFKPSKVVEDQIAALDGY